MTRRTAVAPADRAARVAVFAASGLAAVVGSYVAVGLSPAFVAATVAATLLSLTPDALLAWGIQTLGSGGRALLLAGALALSVGLFAAVAAGAVRAAESLHRGRADALFGAALAQTAVAFLLTVSPASALAAGVAGGLVVAFAARTDFVRGEVSSARRGLLRSLGAAGVALGVGGLAAAARGGFAADAEANAAPGEAEDEQVRALLAAAADRSFDLGIDPLVSEHFYQVDINVTGDPRLDAADWTLTVAGAVERELTVDYAELTSRPAEHRFVTLRCVGESLNGYKMDTALWTGIPVADLLEEVGAPESCCVRLEAADGYYQGFPREALDRGFLAWGMNGRALPRAHGHPVRVLIPGHWGEINVKWITRIEVLDEPVTGYWEERGWHGTGPVGTVAKLHATSYLDGDEIEVGGHAYAGTRGVSRVEVSVDGGETWADAELTEPLPGAVPADGASEPEAGSEAADAWRMWRYRYESNERREVVVRAYEADGTLQEREESEPFPSGATGWVRKEVPSKS